jgi:hypothetical protein
VQPLEKIVCLPPPPRLWQPFAMQLVKVPSYTDAKVISESVLLSPSDCLVFATQCL